MLLSSSPAKRKMQDLVREFDWTSTSLGAMKDWSVPLRVTVDTCLHNQFAVLVLWGNDLVKIYNDAYRELIGSIAHDALGKKAREVWKDIWDDIGPLLEQVQKTGQPARVDDCPFTLNRNGFSENCYFTFSYSPVHETDGSVAGILVTVFETTSSVSNKNDMQLAQETEERLKMAVESTRLGTWDYNPLRHELYWSNECRFIYQVPDDLPLDFAFFEAHLHPSDKEFVLNKVNEAMHPETGGTYSIAYRILRYKTRETRWIKSQGKVYFNAERQPVRFIGTVVDITEEHNREETLRENEMRMRLAIEATNMGTFDWNIVTSSFIFSPQLAKMFGFTRSAVLTQQDFVNLIHPEDESIRFEAHKIAFETGILSYEARFILPNTDIRWIRLNGKMVYDAQHNPVRMYGTTLDVTSTKNQAEKLEELVRQKTITLNSQNEELRQSEERFHKMVEEVQDYAIILLDSAGNIQNWNAGAEHIKGYKEEEILGKHFSIFYTPEDLANNLPTHLLDVARQKGKSVHEGYRQRKNGSKFWGSVVITALHDHRGRIIGFSKVTRDLTERKIAEDKLVRYTLELEQQNQELEQFAYIASHDLQEPLRKIQTFTEIVQRNLDDQKLVASYFEKINNSARRMSELIRSVLNFSRLDKDQEERVQIDLNIVMENVMNDFDLAIHEKNAVITHDVLPVIQGTPSQMNQLFSNLIGNALKFSTTSPEILVSSKIVNDVAADLPGEFYEIAVRDNGIGFEQQFESKIFTMFQRLHGKQTYGGTGIGLALCKKIVENHKGKIRAESKPGNGSTFFVYLPVFHRAS